MNFKLLDCEQIERCVLKLKLCDKKKWIVCDLKKVSSFRHFLRWALPHFVQLLVEASVIHTYVCLNRRGVFSSIQQVIYQSFYFSFFWNRQHRHRNSIQFLYSIKTSVWLQQRANATIVYYFDAIACLASLRVDLCQLQQVLYFSIFFFSKL